jgi:hypothetical protein
MDSVPIGNDKVSQRRQTAAPFYADQLGGQEVVEQVVQPEPDDVLPNFPPNMDIRRSVLFDPQDGHTTGRFSCMEKNSVSKIWAHFLHLNS